jgi:ABC-type transport system involved in multi-copper enzyme maturation permease subunit
MPVRWGPGPVFVYESIAGARRWQFYAMRSISVLAMLASLALVWATIGADTSKALAEGSIKDLARVGESFFYALTVVQVSLVLLAAPAATAGAVCLDRARGTLAHMMVTDLTDAEIVLGKLAARLAPVLAVVAAAVPVLAMDTMLGGVPPEAVVGLTLVSLGLAVFGCALALAVSVRATKTHEVLMAVYAVWGVVILGPLIWSALADGPSVGIPDPPDWVYLFNPYYLAWSDDVGVMTLASWLAGALAASIGLVVFTVWRLRGEVGGIGRRRVARRARRRRAPWWPGPSLDGNPVLWREWRRVRPSRLSRAVWGLFLAFALLGTAWGVGVTVVRGAESSEDLIAAVSALQIFFGLILVSLTAPTALAEERVRGGLDVLLTSPLSTASIVRGKWWAIYRTVPWLAILPAVGMAAVAIASPAFRPPRVGSFDDPLTVLDRLAVVVFTVAWVLAHGAVVTSLGLALATWVSRVGRAVALSVSIFVAVAVGGFMLIEVDVTSPLLEWCGFRRPGDDVIFESVLYGLAALDPIASPFIAAGALSGWHDTPRSLVWLIQTVGLVLTAGAAAGLLGLTVLTFERCLGRSPERPRRAPRPPRCALAGPAARAVTPEPDRAAIEA